MQDRTEAADAAQEVCLLVQKHAGNFCGQSQFSTWLYRITINAALARLRRRQRRREVSYDRLLMSFSAQGAHQEPVIDWSNNLEEQTYRRELARVLSAALSRLRPLDRHVVILSDAQEMTSPEVAELLGLSVSSVKSRLHRSRVYLRSYLTQALGEVATGNRVKSSASFVGPAGISYEGTIS